jgi:hypothetical protein
MVIVEQRGNGIHYTLSAEIHTNGDLVLEGHDLSAWLEESLGRDEYEYRYTVRASDVPRVRALVGADSEAELLERIKELIAPNGISASKAWKAWLRGHHIPYAFGVR